MIKVTVLYPNEENKNFDIKYYFDTHMPLVRKLVGDACKKVEVEKGIAGGTPGSKPMYHIIAHFHYNTVEDFIAAFNPHATTILGDIPNFTDITPVIQISEVVL
jgi:uncharacterized protein (TIGR02118 family)